MYDNSLALQVQGPEDPVADGTGPRGRPRLRTRRKTRNLDAWSHKSGMSPPTPTRALPPSLPWKLNLTSTQVNPSPLPLLGSLWGWEDLVQDLISLTCLCPLFTLWLPERFTGYPGVSPLCALHPSAWPGPPITEEGLGSESKGSCPQDTQHDKWWS